MDFDSYFSREAIAEADKWATDHLGQYRYYRDVRGFFRQCPEPYADLGDLVTGKKPGRERPGERTFGVNLGLAMEDMAVAPRVYRRALEMKIGTWLPL